MSPRRIVKYLAFARMGFTQARAERGELYGRLVFFGIILGVFSALWRAVADTGMPIGESPRTMVWYLAMTEWVLLSAPAIHFQIEDDVRRGDVAYQIARPASYLGSHLAQGLGSLAARAPVLLLVACSAAWIFAGGPPAHPIQLLRAIPLGAAASFVMTAWNLTLGLVAFWLGDVSPVSWIWQKLGFVLGGLMLPIELYPPLVVRIAHFTPFPALLNGPASFLLARAYLEPFSLATVLAGWFLIAWVLSLFLFRRATFTLHLNGG
jgi:ABC-2 type transport system permease protein